MLPGDLAGDLAFPGLHGAALDARGLLDEPGEGRMVHLQVVAAVGVHRDERRHRHARPVDRRLQVEV